MADEPADPAPAPAEKSKRLIDRIGVPEIIDITLVFGLLVMTVAYIVVNPTGTANTLAVTLITGWLTMTGTVVNFHRGSSSGSKSKDDALIKNATPPTPEVKP